MSDSQSIADSAMSSTSRHKQKICAYCGKQEDRNWSRHFTNSHKNIDKKDWKQWVEGEPLLGEPHCENWQDVIIKGVQAINKLPQQKKGNRGTSLVGSRSVINGDAEEEEKKQEELKENDDFGAVAGQSKQSALLGKRSSSEDQQQLEVAVNEELQQEVSAPNDSGSTGSSKPVVIAVGSVKSLNTKQKKKAVHSQMSAKNLNSLPNSTMEQKQQQTLQQSQQEFKVPLPLPQTVYVHQGMRDQQAIQKLKVLEQKTSQPLVIGVAELLDICPYFSQLAVYSYIEQNKGQLLHVKDLLLESQRHWDDLSIEKVAAIAFASFVFGGSVWVNLPKMFASLDADKLEKVLVDFSALLGVKFNANLTRWICSHWKYLEEQTLTLLRYLKEQTIKEDLAANIATLSITANIIDVGNFFIVMKMFSEFPAFNLMLDTLKASISSSKLIQKLSFEEFGSLVFELTSSKNRLVIETNKKELVKLPLTNWLAKIKTLQEESLIQNVGSVQERLNYLGEIYGRLNAVHMKDLYRSDERYEIKMHEVANPPNALQFANAQYASFALSKHSKQLWCIPSGQGKSRVLATIALILLLSGATTKVHLVFDSQHLMRRDQKDFAQWWQLTSLEANIEYHVGLDFQCQPNEITLVDEADELIFTDPAKFIEKTQQFKCICLTATPDNDDHQGSERRVLLKLGFTIFNGQASLNKDIVIDDSSSEIKMDAEIENENELVAFIKKTIQERAVVVYCSEEFEQLLKTSELEFLSMKKDREDIDDNFLRSLDKRDESKKTHVLIVMTSLFGMRGFDYRAPNKGITLVIASSFSNERHKQQGLCRVGRFGDPSSRILLKGVDLINKDQENRYVASLLRFLDQHSSGKQVALKLSQQKEKKKTNDSSSITVVQCDTKRRSQIVSANKTATAVGKEERGNGQIESFFKKNQKQEETH